MVAANRESFINLNRIPKTPEFITVQPAADSRLEVDVSTFSDFACGGPDSGFIKESVLRENQTGLLLAAAWVEVEDIGLPHKNSIAEMLWDPEQSQLKYPISLEIIGFIFAKQKGLRDKYDWQYDPETHRVVSAAWTQEREHCSTENGEAPLLLMQQQREDYDPHTGQILHQIWRRLDGELGWVQQENTWDYDTDPEGLTTMNRQCSEEEQLMETDSISWRPLTSRVMSYAWQASRETEQQADRLRKLFLQETPPLPIASIDNEAVLHKFYPEICKAPILFNSSFDREARPDFSSPGPSS